MKTQLIETDLGNFKCLVNGEFLSDSWKPTNELVWLRASSHPLEDEKDYLFQKWVDDYEGDRPPNIVWVVVNTYKAVSQQPIQDE